MTAYEIARAVFLAGLFIGIPIGASIVAGAIWLLSKRIDDVDDDMEEA